MKRLLLITITLLTSVVLQAQQKIELQVSTQQIKISVNETQIETINGNFAIDPFEIINKQLTELSAESDKIAEITINFSKDEYFFTKAAKIEKAPEVKLQILGNQTVFRGDKIFSGEWKKSDSLWEMQLSTDEAEAAKGMQIFSDGRMCQVAGTKDQGFFKLKRVSEFVKNQGPGKQPANAVKYFKLPFDAAELMNEVSVKEQQNVYLHFYHHWDNTRYKIGRYNKMLKLARHRGKGMKQWNNLHKDSRFYLSNIRSGLDSAGEWFITGENKLLYMPFPGQDIEQAELSYPLTDKIFEGDAEFSNTEVSGIAFINTALFTGNNMEFMPAQSANQIDAALTFDNVENLKISDCHFANIGKYAVWLRTNCNRSEISSCIIENTGCGGIRLGETAGVNKLKGAVPRNNLITNNIIRHGGRLIECGAGILSAHASENEISHNEIYDFFYTGISVGWVWGYKESPSKGNKILNNHIHKIGQGILSDMAGIYTLGKSEGTIISGNVIHNIRSYSYGGWGLYTDEGSSNILMEKNLVFDTDTGAFHQHYGRENIIKNNIFGLGLKYQIQATRIEKHLSFTFTNNIVIKSGGNLFEGPFTQMNLKVNNNWYFFADGSTPDFTDISFSDWKKSGYDQDSMIGNPGFRDLKSLDFFLTEDSPAVKAGFKPFDYTKAGVKDTMRNNIENKDSEFLFK